MLKACFEAVYMGTVIGVFIAAVINLVVLAFYCIYFDYNMFETPPLLMAWLSKLTWFPIPVVLVALCMGGAIVEGLKNARETETKRLAGSADGRDEQPTPDGQGS